MANISASEGSTMVSQIIRYASETMMQSESLYRSYLLTHNLDDIQQAVRCAQEVLDLVPPDVPLMPIVLYNLARPLLRRFQSTRQIEDITKAIELFQHACQLLTDDNPMRHAFQRSTSMDVNLVRQKCSGYLCISYLERDGNLDGSLELNSADVYSQSRTSLETLVHDLGEDEETFAYFWSKMSVQLRLFPPHPSLQVIDSVIQLCRQALEFFSFNPSVSECGDILCILGRYLAFRFNRQRKLEDINEAIDCCCVGVELVLPTCKLFVSYLEFASTACASRFEVLRRREDLDNALRYAEHAVRFANSLELPVCLDSLATAMVFRYETAGDVNDLDAAIDASSRAVDIAGDSVASVQELPSLLNNFALNLKWRFWRSGRAEDMSEAIAAAQRAVDLLPPEDPRLLSFLANLSNYEIMQYVKLLDVDYLRRAHHHMKQAQYIQQECSIREEDNGRELVLINSTASVLLHTGELEMAIAIACEGTSPAYAQHPLAVQSYDLLCSCLFERWKTTHEEKDIDEAISTAHRMIELTQAKAEELVLGRKSLGEFLYHRYKSTGDDKNREEALAVLLEAFRMSAGAPYLRIKAGQVAIDILSEQADWNRARKLSREILDLLVILNGRSLGWQDKQYWLREFSHRAATYASISLEAGSDVFDVIDLVETCRGSILGHLVDSRTDLNDLTEAAPEKAERFMTLRNEINTMIDPFGNTNTRLKQITRRIEAEGEIRACLKEIRKLEGFHQFMLGPTQGEIKAAAARGPILIVNVTSIRSDAIIITKDSSVLLPLPGLKFEKVQEYLSANLTSYSFEEMGRKNKKYRQLQKWLWDNCVKLIFKTLDDLVSGPRKFHVWWIGIGIASSLPFHAAGIYTRNVNDNETALSRVISSYTPTLKVLIHGRRKAIDKNDPPVSDLLVKSEILKSKPRLTIIVMPSTPGMGDLEGVQREAEEIQKLVQDTYSTHILVQPNAKDTMAHMAKCEVVHFACHGKSAFPDLSDSHLLLQTTTACSTMPTIDELKLKDVAAADLSHGKLAFLSACSTAENASRSLLDEVLHLTSGFQVAGYLHVIGNLWMSDDEVSVTLVKGFYHHLVAAGELGDGGNVARALNEALTDVAQKYFNAPLCWAQFVHFGV